MMLMIFGVMSELKSAAALQVVNDPLYLEQQQKREHRYEDVPKSTVVHDYEYDAPASVVSKVVPSWDPSTYEVALKATTPRHVPTPAPRVGTPVSAVEQTFEMPREVFEYYFKDIEVKEGSVSSEKIYGVKFLACAIDEKIVKMKHSFDSFTPEQRGEIIQLVKEFNVLLLDFYAVLFGKKSKKSSFTHKRTDENLKEIEKIINNLASKQKEIDDKINELVRPKAQKEAVEKEKRRATFETVEELDKIRLQKFSQEADKTIKDPSKFEDFKVIVADLYKGSLTPETQRKIAERVNEVSAHVEKAASLKNRKEFRSSHIVVIGSDGKEYVVPHAFELGEDRGLYGTGAYRDWSSNYDL